MKQFYDVRTLTRWLLFFFITFSTVAMAQNRIIEGTVSDSRGESLPGVIISQEGTTNQTISDAKGNYKITLVQGSNTLTFSFLGFKTKSVKAFSSILNVSLDDDVQGLNEVLVIGYGTQSRGENTSATSSIKADAIQQISPVNAFDAMQGRLAGVSIATNGGPGEGSDIKIRGVSTILGGADPLYVVDGQQLENIDNLNPNDIESIEVIKDGASAAIFGSKSANGVVMITTKKGKESEKPRIDVNYINTYGYVYNKIPVANSRQRFDFEKLRDGAVVIEPDLDSLSLLNTVSTDVQDEIIRPSQRNEINLSFRGGTKASDYFNSTSYLNDKGVIVGTNYDRFSNNLNLNFKISEKLSAGSRILLSYEERNGADEVAVFRNLSWRQSNLLLRDNDGSYFPTFGGRTNPLAYAYEQTNQRRDLKGIVFSNVELKILKSLSLKSTLGVNYGLTKFNNFTPTILLDPGLPANGSERQNIGYDFQQENFLNYNQKFGKHSITGLLGFSYQKWRLETSNLFAQAFSSDLITTFNNVSVLDAARTNTGASEHSLASQFGRFTYDFDKKYLLSATLRRDGSSRFGEDNRWGIFPALSLGWIISKEKFMENISSNILTNLKLRAGISRNGNERISDYESQYTYSPGEWYLGVNGYAPGNFASPLLKWESTENLNVGADFELMKGKITFSVDYYTKTTKDLLYNIPVPEEFGVRSTYQSNVGSIQNRGFEFDIMATPVRTKQFNWKTSFNLAFNQNEVLSLGNPLGFEFTAGNRGQNFNYLVQPGQPLGNMYAFRNLGVYAYNESNAYNEAGERLTPNFVNGVFNNYTLNGEIYTGTVKKMRVGNTVVGGGDIIWEDQNGDFVIDAENDRTIIGNGLPKYTGGFFNELKYKNYSFSFLFDFSFGQQIYREYDDYRNTSSNNGVFTPDPKFIDGAWRKQGDVTVYPSLQNRAQNRIGADSQYLSDADYIKLRNVRFNYILPKSLYKNVNWVSNVSLNISANNLLTFTNYEGYNPELGGRGNNLTPGYDEIRYPNTSQLIFGLRVGL